MSASAVKAARVTDALVDLGKTRCRLRLVSEGQVLTEGSGVGAPGLAAPEGVSAAAHSLLTLLDSVVPALAPTPLRAIVVGAAGAIAAPAAADQLAGELLERTPARAAVVTSDAITSHVGALGAEPGVALVVGTGAVAVALDERGRLAVEDGGGPVTGDLGSGAWIGAEALRRAEAGAQPLAALARARFGDDWHDLAADAGSYELARRRGTFVPDVARSAREGDPVSRAVISAAADHLAATVRAARDPLFDRSAAVPVALLGGLTTLGALLTDRLACGIAPSRFVPAQGSALDGAATLLEREDLPHEAYVVRRGA